MDCDRRFGLEAVDVVLQAIALGRGKPHAIEQFAGDASTIRNGVDQASDLTLCSGETPLQHGAAAQACPSVRLGAAIIFAQEYRDQVGGQHPLAQGAENASVQLGSGDRRAVFAPAPLAAA